MKQTLTALCMAALTITACTKTGSTGPAGANGTNGTANISTWTVTAAPANWQGGTSGFYYIDATIDSITANVLNGGDVNVFYQSPSSAWIAMPFLNYQAAASIDYGFEYNTGTVRIWAQSSNGAAITFSSNIVFKVVVIPPAQP